MRGRPVTRAGDGHGNREAGSGRLIDLTAILAARAQAEARIPVPECLHPAIARLGALVTAAKDGGARTLGEAARVLGEEHHAELALLTECLNPLLGLDIPSGA
jgi:hypothetical protein